jgi:hypothetical protein
MPEVVEFWAEYQGRVVVDRWSGGDLVGMAALAITSSI